MNEETYAIQLSGRGRGAVATVAVQGPSALAFVARHFSPKHSVQVVELPKNRITFGTWKWQDSCEELVICRTQTDEVEVHCHGGSIAVRNVMDSLRSHGVKEVSAEQWVDLGEQDSFVSEAICRIPRAQTEQTLAVLLHQARGAMSRLLRESARLIRSGHSGEAIARLQRCRDLTEVGQHLTVPWRVVVVGPPNAGKSSLINALVGYDRSVVFDQPGTTRDTVTVMTAVAGWPFELVDTAGLRVSTDSIEAEGVRRAKQNLQRADLVLVVRDLSQPQSRPVEPHSDGLRLHVGTKLDLANDSLLTCDIRTSARTGEGIDDLLQRLVRTVLPFALKPDDAVPLRRETAEVLSECIQHLKAGDLELAVSKLRFVPEPRTS